jgi:histidinol-phosphate aminotransferase
MTRLPEPVASLAAVERWREGGRERAGFVGLDRNERVGPLPDWFVDEVRAAITSELMCTYPNVGELADELAAATGIAPERLLVTPGNDAAIKAAFQSYVRPGDRVAMLDPSYAMYRVYATMFGAEPTTAGYDERLRLDVDALHAGIAAGARLVLVANPNQPTGTVLAPSELVGLLEHAAETGALVFVDEAYEVFSPETSALPLLDAHPNLLVVRTFSKIGLAGVRIGFAAGSPEVIGTLFKVRSAAEVNAVAIACARILIRHPEIGRDYAAEVAAGRAVVEERARALGLEPLPTHANFLQLRLPEGTDPAAVVAGLRERRFLVRGPFGDPCLARCVRVTLGPPALMREFADALEATLRP